MTSTRTTPLTAVRLVREVLALDGDPGPEALLRSGSAGPRGFWGEGPGDWVAWRGSLLSLRVDAELGGGDRFERVLEEAGRVELSGEGGAPPRFHGGFSFRDDHREEGSWQGFPAARFVLPAVELQRAGESTRLVAQAVARAGSDEGALRRTLRERLSLLAGSMDPSIAPSAAPSTNGKAVVRRPSDREAFEAGVRTILAAIARGDLRKAVLARILDLELPYPVDPVEGLRRLRGANPTAHLFLLEPEPGRALLGAAPEVVASVRDGMMRCTAVAGSVARGGDPEEDRALGERLLASAKDREEHELTLREMLEQLAPRSLGPVETDPDPGLLVLPRIQHLETRIRARVAPGESVLTLLRALHPTPAVCGLPRGRALELLREIEGFPRGWYAGPVGWFDPSGEGAFVPALRSAVGGGSRWRLFAGAGVVPGSDPALEWDETEIKLESALRALVGGTGA